MTIRNLSHVELLLDALKNTPYGAIEGQEKGKIISLLANCWHELEGADQTAMKVSKLHRAEALMWRPPVLSFTIERHGASVLGSSRAELHEWEINLEQATAHVNRGRYRQIGPTAPRLDVKPIVERVCDAVQQGPTSSCDLVEKRVVVWTGDHQVSIWHGKLIPGGGPQQTVAGRRKRFRKELTNRMQDIGWRLVGVARSMTFVANLDQ
jgi:hypothetical protein